MSVLFKPYKIGELEIRNRFMRSATTSAYANERGIIGQEIIKIYENLARGGIGLIVKGHLYIDDRGKCHPGMAGISSEEHIPKLKELTDTVHRHNGIIFAQINFGGYQAGAGERMGPNNYEGEGWKAREMTRAEIWSTVDSFGSAADRAIRAGFDGVQIHAAHGYLISQFLSKHANKRTDEWGGPLKNRMMLLKEIYEDIRGRIGYNVPVSMKMNCDDFSYDGFTVEEASQVAEAMVSRGIDLIEVSAGGIGQENQYRDRAIHSNPALSEANYAGHCEKIRATTKPKSLALVNGIRSLKIMQLLINSGICDMVSMSRPFIKDPELIKTLQTDGNGSSCTSCDACDSLFGKEIMRCLQT
jgi:2,4-dienoyl-CoA reductase-like NADH-dependent reductase (Old Yellow Enzyme family)